MCPLHLLLLPTSGSGLQDKKNNPPPPRNPALPPKPQGQTVGSFRKGLKMLPEAIARNVKDTIRCVCMCACACMRVAVQVGKVCLVGEGSRFVLVGD